ncbi:hypothetical protein GH714_024600 [Hevea brasiliensis]|uniref:PGG domain-containing protein n=1 Tax=Hevea brasiliensis TaxID=3981 RepID=A0A6A6KU07_HEVBR|nr:hypothetical protein GH714_024600 [Hevea brasiliensis]
MKIVALSVGTLLLIGKICGTAKDNYGAEGTKWVQTDGKKPIDPIEIHQKALDDLVNVNSFFTIAVFVGLSFASSGQHSLENRPECDADPGIAMRLILYEVISFACFLLSSLVAKTLKGLCFLALSMANVIQIRIGKLSCGSVYAYRSWIIVLLALFIYIPSMFYAIWKSLNYKPKPDRKINPKHNVYHIWMSLSAYTPVTLWKLKSKSSD